MLTCDRPAIECGCPECLAFIAQVRSSHRVARQSRSARIEAAEVEAALLGARPYSMTRGSILEVVRLLTVEGASAREIALTLRTEPRTVHRYRSMLREAGRLP